MDNLLIQSDFLIKIDSREKKNEHIIQYFKDNAIDYDVTKLYFGDYARADKISPVIERKASFQEFANNCGKNHARFKAELERLDKSNAKMYILIEDKKAKQLGDMCKCYLKYNKKTPPNLRMTNKKMYSISCKWKEKHNIEFIFCKKEEAGKLIFDILSGNYCK